MLPGPSRRGVFGVFALFWGAAIVFVLSRLFEQPGLGIGHLYYVSILLAARATGPGTCWPRSRPARRGSGSATWS